MEIRATNHAHALMAGLHSLMHYGNDIEVRGQKTKELADVTFFIDFPTERCLFLPYRNDNIFAKVAETVWLIAGRNDIEWLSHYLPRAPEWSDNGKTWRGGYGPRLRSYNGASNKVDQIAEIVRILNEDPSSRRAVMTIFDPSEDYQESKDIPCNVAIHWMVRNGNLYMKIFQRSSDIWWGFSGINMFEWSVLQQMIAFWTGTTVGRMTYHISSLHIYERHFQKMKKMLEKYEYGTSIMELYGNDLYRNNRVLGAPSFYTKFEDMKIVNDAFFKTESIIREHKNFTFHIQPTAYSNMLYDTFIRMLSAYNGLLQQNIPQVMHAMDSMASSDLKYAAMEYINRRSLTPLFDNDVLKEITRYEQENCEEGES